VLPEPEELPDSRLVIPPDGFSMQELHREIPLAKEFCETAKTLALFVVLN